MTRDFLPTIFFLIVIGCSQEEELLIPAELDYPRVMIVFCQSSMDNALRTVEYEYDNDKLITETTIQRGEEQNKTTYNYNSDSQIMSEIYLTDWRKTEKTYVYNGINQLVNIIYELTDYDSNGQIIDESEIETPREYENNQLVKEWETWGGFNTYEYTNGKVIAKIDYTKNGEEHHITTFKYSGDLLIQETKETKVGGLIYQKTFEYDSQNRISKIRDGENIIEENDYNANKLMEKRTYYFGIDPGFDICYGNYVYRYKY